MAEDNMLAIDLRRRIEELGPWFHNVELRGIRTAPNHPLGDYPAVKWSRFAQAITKCIPGRSVLDVGCNAGFYSVEMWRAGASRVVGIDTDQRYLAQARLTAEIAGADISFRQLSVYDVAELNERFDVVLFMGVLYHLRHPLLALDLLREHATRDLFVFQTMQRGSDEAVAEPEDADFLQRDHFDRREYTKLHFIEHRYAGDPTNWWVPNRACSEAMLRSAGFAVVDHPEAEVYICRTALVPAT